MKRLSGEADAERFVIVGTAGHIDHGKTALVYALTGTDTDRLSEEKQRGITIDLGFASLDLDDPEHGRLHLSLIDVPGHHAFIRNMLSGAGGIDCVMLVVAADDGVKAQTAEHLAICGLLGIERGIIVLTKCDIAGPEQLLRAREGIGRLVERTFLQDAPIIAVSAIRGDSIAELRAALAEMAAGVLPRSAEHIPRLPLDRSFSVRGFGTVVTGTLHSGEVHIGETLEQIPAGRLVKVRGLQVHGTARDIAQAPCRVALNLAGVEIAQIARGETLTLPETFAPAVQFDVELEMLPEAPVIKHGSQVRVHAFTFDSLATLLFFNQRNSCEPGSGLARLRLAQPMFVLPGDRFVLRQCSPAVTVGGGRVLDASPLPGARKAAVLEWLLSMQSADPSEQLRLRIARRGVEGISLAVLVAETGLTNETLRRRISSLIESGGVVQCGASGEASAHWITSSGLAEATQLAERELRAGGTLTRAELRSKTRLSALVFEAVLGQLTRGGYELAGDAICEAGNAGAAQDSTQRQMRRVEDIYLNAGLASPLLAEVSKQLAIDPGDLRDVITLLLRARRLVRMGADDAFTHLNALEKLYADLRHHRGENFDVGSFKSFTGLTRKHAIPLLEHLDQVRVTRNNGGTRIVL